MVGTEILRMKVEDVMSKADRTVGPLDNLSEALGKMKKFGLMELPVVEKDRLKGLLTLRTITRRRKLPITAQVRHLMITPPKVSGNDRLPKVAELLVNRDFSSIPVTYRGNLQGMISRRDIVATLLNDPGLRNRPIETIMNFAPVKIQGDLGLLSGANLMKVAGESYGAVVDREGRYLGTISLPDIVNIMEKPPKKPQYGHRGEKVHRDIQISSLTSPTEALTRGSYVTDAVNLLLKLRVPTIHVMDGDELVGSVSEVDLLELILRKVQRSGPLVQIAGMDEVKLMDAEELNNLIHKHLKKIERYTDITAVTVRIRHHHHESDMDKYTVNVKLSTSSDFYSREGFDHDLQAAINDAFHHVEKGVRKEKDKRKR